MESSSARPVGIGFFGSSLPDITMPPSALQIATRKRVSQLCKPKCASPSPEHPRDNITAYLLPFPSSQLAFLREQESPDSIDTGKEKGNSRFHGKEISSTGLQQHGKKKKGDIPDP
ncbi:hypothetical protein RUM43_002432 [Polyplax serrata]|uniref:Uncharacterized protein n=1 Tax=Polyplax serrata TaxID=468196 RepID=A0AAN8PMC5_POLSC